MKKILSVLCLLVLTALPAWAQDGGKLGPPDVTLIRALDYSQLDSELGWCIEVKWKATPGAEAYAIRVVGKKGLAPRKADGSPPNQAEWRTTTDYSTNSAHPEQVSICGLADKQRVKFRLRTIDLDSPLDAYGIASAPFAVKLRKFGKAQISASTGVPTLELFG